MTFPSMPGFDTITLTRDLDPVMAARDQDLGDRFRQYPKLLPLEPVFSVARQTGREWRILDTCHATPDEARRCFAYWLDTEIEIRPDDHAYVRAASAAMAKLNPEDGDPIRKDEWEFCGERYRIIRILRFTLMGDRILEPPRPSDVEPPRGPDPVYEMVLDPMRPCGEYEMQLRLNISAFTANADANSAQIVAEARHAAQTHPGVLILPPAFEVTEVRPRRGWRTVIDAEGPDSASVRLYEFLRFTAPAHHRHEHGSPPTEDERAAYHRAADEVRGQPGPDFAVLGRTFRTLRITRALRLGREGPEGPRPSDEDDAEPGAGS
ncbi:DUF5954 family protein [Actinomadura flavalba]|uniref:DUF5954 family protein n=1 Tax=Actinomadura flavalba TaxID=1120938 RepID=UPI000362EF47|nr:DUF5954 family protein [Actinomadura flavalba]